MRICHFKVGGLGLGTCGLETVILRLLDLVLEHVVENLPLKDWWIGPWNTWLKTCTLWGRYCNWSLNMWFKTCPLVDGFGLGTR